MPNKIWELDANSITCGALPRESAIEVDVTDAGSGVASVEASWTIEGNPGSVVLSGAGNGPYTGTFGPFAWLTVPDTADQIISITVTARDQSGNESTTSVAVRLHSLGLCFG